MVLRVKGRGMRGMSIPGGYILGRLSKGKGDAQLLKISDLSSLPGGSSGGGTGGSLVLPGLTRLSRVANQSIPSATWTAVEWDTDTEVVSGSWDVGDPTKITVPPDATRMRLTVKSGWGNTTGNGRYVRIDKNGGTANGGGLDIRSGLNESGSSIITDWENVTPGDYFEVRVLQNTGGNLDFSGNSFGGASYIQAEWNIDGSGGGGGGIAATDVYGEFTKLQAAAALSGHRAVKSTSAGKIDYPDISTLGDGLAVIGITTGAISSGAVGQVQLSGRMDEPSWTWTPALPIYVDDNGVLTQSLPTGNWILQIAVALKATAIVIEPRTVISLP